MERNLLGKGTKLYFIISILLIVICLSGCKKEEPDGLRIEKTNNTLSANGKYKDTNFSLNVKTSKDSSDKSNDKSENEKTSEIESVNVPQVDDYLKITDPSTAKDRMNEAAEEIEKYGRQLTDGERIIKNAQKRADAGDEQSKVYLDSLHKRWDDINGKVIDTSEEATNNAFKNASGYPIVEMERRYEPKYVGDTPVKLENIIITNKPGALFLKDIPEDDLNLLNGTMDLLHEYNVRATEAYCLKGNGDRYWNTHYINVDTFSSDFIEAWLNTDSEFRERIKKLQNVIITDKTGVNSITLGMYPLSVTGNLSKIYIKVYNDKKSRAITDSYGIIKGYEPRKLIKYGQVVGICPQAYYFDSVKQELY